MSESKGYADYREVRFGPRSIEVPQSWGVKSLEDLTQDQRRICYGVVKPGSNVENGIPLIKVEDLERNRVSISDSQRIPTELHEEYSRSIVRGGEVLISVQGTVGRVGIVPHDIGEANISRTVARIAPSNELDARWLKNYLISEEFQRYIDVVTTGSTRDSLNIGDLREVPVVLPPLPEQRRVADILSKVDEQIQQTDRIITETEELKRGLMQDLLTTGTGEAVKTREERIGPMPVDVADDWPMKYFDDVIQLNPNDEIPDKDSFPYLPMDAVNEETREVDYWERRDAEDCTRVRFREGDTVYAKITPCTENGKIAFIEQPDELAFGSTEFLVFRAREGEILPKYVYYLSNLPQFRAVTISLMEGSTGRQRVPSDTFEQNLRVPVPPMEEQQTIIEVLDRVQRQSKQERETKRNLQELKRGLMQDLLTGKVRVNAEN